MLQGRALKRPSSSQVSRGADGVYVQGIIFKDETTGLEEVHLCVGSPDLGRLKAGIWAGFEQMLERHLSRREFGGEIRIVILAEITPQGPELWRAIGEVEERLKAAVVAGKLKTASGHPVRIALEYTSREEE